ncbi:MAG: hypothetical protein JF614_10670 [Acidobacteria bacterium]|jgi:hypothetical protein|nr:hypothetical protein [Acidobacteriota bacterium]
MSKLGKIALGAVAVNVMLALLHGWLNLGIDPARVLSFKKGTAVAEETRFRVGFLPVT